MIMYITYLTVALRNWLWCYRVQQGFTDEVLLAASVH